MATKKKEAKNQHVFLQRLLLGDVSVLGLHQLRIDYILVGLVV
jgi:hypothetical protein